MSYLSNSDIVILAFLIPTFLWTVWAIGSNFLGAMSKEVKRDKLRAKSAILDFNLEPANTAMAVRNKK